MPVMKSLVWSRMVPVGIPWIKQGSSYQWSISLSPAAILCLFFFFHPSQAICCNGWKVYLLQRPVFHIGQWDASAYAKSQGNRLLSPLLSSWYLEAFGDNATVYCTQCGRAPTFSLDKGKKAPLRFSSTSKRRLLSAYIQHVCRLQATGNNVIIS